MFWVNDGRSCGREKDINKRLFRFEDNKHQLDIMRNREITILMNGVIVLQQLRQPTRHVVRLRYNGNERPALKQSQCARSFGSEKSCGTRHGYGKTSTWSRQDAHTTSNVGRFHTRHETDTVTARRGDGTSFHTRQGRIQGRGPGGAHPSSSDFMPTIFYTIPPFS